MSRLQRLARAASRTRLHVVAMTSVVLAILAPTAWAQELLLEPVADATLYSEDGDGANGAGEGLFAGRTALGERRRALLRFDLSSLPAGASLQAAELTLTMDRSITGTVPVRVHRALASWGEGSAHAPGEEGAPAPAGTGDATWQWRFHATDAWATPGGDMAAGPSASADIDGTGPYVFTGPGLLADIEAWRSDPAGNHGWFLVADETLAPPSAKRFASRQHADPALRPLLRVAYSVAAPPAPGARQVPAAGWIALLLLLVLVVAAPLRHRSRP